MVVIRNWKIVATVVCDLLVVPPIVTKGYIIIVVAVRKTLYNIHSWQSA